jgi:hypothetical protein
MATNRFNLVSLLFSALLLIPFAITTLTLAESSSVPAADGAFKMPPAFPEWWGPPPRAMTRDYVPLPGNYGHGSGTLRKWILTKMEEDVASGIVGGAPDSSSSSSAIRIAADDGELWPKKSLVGWTGEDAKFAVLAGDKTLREENVHIVPEDSMVTMDYREDRVRIFVDADGRVVSQPTIG